MTLSQSKQWSSTPGEGLPLPGERKGETMPQLTLGELIIMELALVQFLKEMDVSMQCGQMITEIVGKIEYQVSKIKAAAAQQIVPPLVPPKPEEPVAGK